MLTHFQRFTVASALICSSVMVLSAASLDKALTDADGRRKAAENGLRQIKAKSTEQADQLRELYTAATSRNNAWVDIVCDAIEQGASAAPDVSTAAEPAAVSLIAWVGGRNKALGLPDLTGQYAESVKKVVLQNISDIADGAWRNNRGRDQTRRQKAAADLRDRLSWRKFEELQ